MIRYCSMCGAHEEADIAGHCEPCAQSWIDRKEKLKAEGFYKNMDKLRQPRYFNFLRENASS